MIVIFALHHKVPNIRAWNPISKMRVYRRGTPNDLQWTRIFLQWYVSFIDITPVQGTISGSHSLLTVFVYLLIMTCYISLQTTGMPDKTKLARLWRIWNSGCTRIPILFVFSFESFTRCSGIFCFCSSAPIHGPRATGMERHLNRGVIVIVTLQRIPIGQRPTIREILWANRSWVLITTINLMKRSKWSPRNCCPVSRHVVAL